MVTNRTKEILKIKYLSEGKHTLYDPKDVLLETYQVIKNGLNSNDKSELKKLSFRVLAALKGVQKIDKVLDEVLRCDGNCFPSTRLASIDKANRNMKIKFSSALKKSNRAGKTSASLMSLKQAGCSKSKKLL